MPFCTKNVASFYQDRLGTNTGKTHTRDAVFLTAALVVRLRTAAVVVVARVAELAAVAVPVATEATDKILSRLVCTVLY